MRALRNYLAALAATLFFAALSHRVQAQAVGISAGFITPDPSSILELRSTTLGFLPPRMTSTGNVSSPVQGLMVYQTNAPAGLYYYTGSAWVQVSTGSSGITSLNGLTGSTQTFVNGTNVTMTSAGTTHTLGWTGQLSAANGGTGIGTYAVGDILYASATTPALSRLAAVATGNALISGGTNTAPSWGKIGLTSHVSGVLPVANGGTNNGTLAVTNGGVIYTDGTRFQNSGVGTSGYFLKTNGLGFAPVWAAAADLDNSNTFNIGPQIMYADQTTITPLILWGATGQAANLQEWRNDIGTAIAYVTAAGVFTGDGSGLTNISASSFSGSLGGDVTGTQAVTSVDRIKGVTLGTTTATDKNILIANGTTWESKAVSGDATITNGGAVTVGKINGATLGTTTATDKNILIADGSSWVSRAVSGDVTIGNTGVTAIGAGKVTNAMLAGSIAASKLIGTDIATVGTITTGTWNGTKLSEAYGGTNQSTYTTGDILYASASNTLSKLAGVAIGNALISGGVGTAPSWGKIDLTAHVTGLLPLANGGTNASLTAANGGVVYSDASQMQITAAGTAGQVLQSNGAAAPSWKTPTQYNQSTAAQGAGFSADTYLTGSSVPIPANSLKAGTRYHLVFDVSKTNAGTAGPVIIVRFGTAASTADAARLTFTFSSGTAVADIGTFEVWVTFRTVGSGTSAVIQGTAQIRHGLSTTGLSTKVSETLQVTSAGFDSTPSSSVIGVSVNGGGSAVWTVQNVQATLENF